MTKKLEEVLNLPQAPKPTDLVAPSEEVMNTPPTTIINLQDKLEEFDKISVALPRVEGLGQISDTELDGIAKKAEDAFDDLMDLGMNVEARFGSRMFEVAGNMLKTALDAKSAKIDKKLKMVELQLKKLAIDKRNNPEAEDDTPVETKGYIVSDRNSILAQLRNVNTKK